MCSELSFAFLPESSAALAFEGKTVPLLLFLPAKSSERIPFQESCWFTIRPLFLKFRLLLNDSFEEIARFSFNGERNELIFRN